ncbi:hypothetical protein IMSAGC008_00370 [Muribaculaceae bacterium]|jgi:hypothetical protein|nr:hypothetical protein IMSAGC008_00370 [Muribaculaceae bacterium]
MPMIIDLDPKKVPLTEFMKALGYDSPVAADGVLRTYNAPYDDRHEPTMVINIETNLWRDTKSCASGGIYDLAYEMTGSCNRSELLLYIATQLSATRKIYVRHEPDPPMRQLPPLPKATPDKPKRRFKLF